MHRDIKAIVESSNNDPNLTRRQKRLRAQLRGTIKMDAFVAPITRSDHHAQQQPVNQSFKSQEHRGTGPLISPQTREAKSQKPFTSKKSSDDEEDDDDDGIICVLTQRYADDKRKVTQDSIFALQNNDNDDTNDADDSSSQTQPDLIGAADETFLSASLIEVSMHALVTWFFFFHILNSKLYFRTLLQQLFDDDDLPLSEAHSQAHFGR